MLPNVQAGGRPNTPINHNKLVLFGKFSNVKLLLLYVASCYLFTICGRKFICPKRANKP